MCGGHDFSSREGGNETRAEEAPPNVEQRRLERGQASFFMTPAVAS